MTRPGAPASPGAARLRVAAARRLRHPVSRPHAAFVRLLAVLRASQRAGGSFNEAGGPGAQTGFASLKKAALAEAAELRLEGVRWLPELLRVA